MSTDYSQFYILDIIMDIMSTIYPISVAEIPSYVSIK